MGSMLLISLNAAVSVRALAVGSYRFLCIAQKVAFHDEKLGPLYGGRAPVLVLALAIKLATH